MTKPARMLLVAVVAALAAAPALADGPGPNARANHLLVVTHLDIIPTFADPARELLEDYVAESRHDPGVLVFKMITWTPTTNHFQLIEVFENERAFDTHVSAAHTIQFRRDLQPYIGAPYDERIYRYTSHSGAIAP